MHSASDDWERSGRSAVNKLSPRMRASGGNPGIDCSCSKVVKRSDVACAVIKRSYNENAGTLPGFWWWILALLVLLVKVFFFPLVQSGWFHLPHNPLAEETRATTFDNSLDSSALQSQTENTCIHKHTPTQYCRWRKTNKGNSTSLQTHTYTNTHMLY